MSRTARPVVVFFAFANDRAERTRYLRNLPEEQRRVRDAMEGAVEAGLCEIVERANATVDEVLDVFQDYRGRVALFHFGGHAGDAELLLESTTGAATVAHAGGLARFLGEQRGLELVFLNGCSSRGQVQGLLDAGVPAVVATSQAIDDAVATEFSARFYRALASGAPLRTAFGEAQGAVQTRRGELARGTYRSFVPDVVTEERWPWELYMAPGAEERVARWSLPLAARDPLFGLPSPLALDLPASPFKHLYWFTREDAEVFFGRGREIRDLYEAVTLPEAAPIVLLFGATGVGKSSLLAAGLKPRLETTHEVPYLRRDGALGLAGTLATALKEKGTCDDLGAAWRAREEATGKPLVVTLDQAEEAWTRPLAAGREAEELAAALRSIFAVREKRPRGRLILGFRKEWLAEVLRLLDAEALPRVLVELTHLDREAIAEAIAGPASTERLKRHYGLKVEPELPGIIADDLLEDPGAAIAPALQILLTKMWALAAKESPGSPRFTVELYQRLKRGGILLDDFLGEQLDGLRQWRPELVDSGLTLDLLGHHTTALGTAETRQTAEIVTRYEGRQEVVELLRQCQDRYLLSANDDTTRLAHDTLAPLVRRRFEASDLPGQRALRILQQRAVEWSGGKEGPPLDEVDLTIVEQGAGGMCAWTADERRLIGSSRREQQRRAQRRRILQIGAAVAVLVIMVAAGVAWWQRDAALEAKQKAQDIARVAVAGELLETDPTRAVLVLLEVAKPDETAYAARRMRELLERPLSEAILRGHEREVLSAAFSPDGTRVLTASRDGTARVWAADGLSEPVVLRGHGGPVLAAFSPDGQRVVTASTDGTARVWSVDGSGEPVILRGHQGGVLSASFSPDGRQIVTASEDGTARVWSADGSGEPMVLRGHEGSVLSAIFNPDGTRVVTISEDGTARVWADDSSEPVVLRGHEGWVLSAAFSPDGQRVVTASDDGTARVRATDGSGKPLVFRAHKDGVISAAFSPDGTRIVTASMDSSAQVWAADGSGEPVVLPGHHGWVMRAAFSPDGARVVTAGKDGTARVWTADDFGEPVVLRGHQGPVSVAAFSPDGARVVTASQDGTARVWAADPVEPVVLRGHQGPVWSAAFSPDGVHVVTASADSTARVWAADGSGEPLVFRAYKDWVFSAAFSPDGTHIVTASADSTARVWAADGSGKPVVLSGHEGPVWSAAFSPDGTRIVTASEDKTARVWAADGSGKPVVLSDRFPVRSAAFSPDGTRVVTTPADSTARVWAADGSGEPLVLRAHEDWVVSAAFSPDGTRIVTASRDATARVWAADGSGEPVVLRGHKGPVLSASFSPDGTRIVTAHADGTAGVWEIGKRLLSAISRKATRACLEPDFRVSYLGESKREAAATYQRCRGCVWTWGHQFDSKTLRAAPEEAWKKWQQCMSR